jgi:hypothetical protein
MTLTPYLLRVLALSGLFVITPPETAPQMLVGEADSLGPVRSVPRPLSDEQLVVWYVRPFGPPVIESFDEDGRPLANPRGTHLRLIDVERHVICSAGTDAFSPTAGQTLVIASCQVAPGQFDLFAEVHGPEGPVGAIRQVAADRAGSRLGPSMARLDDGTYWLAWIEDQNLGSSDTQGWLRAVRLDSIGRPVSEFVDVSLEDSVVRTSFSEPVARLVPLPDAGFAVAWREGRGHWSAVRLQAFDGDGRPRWKEPIAVGTDIRFAREPTLAVSHDGHFLLAWAEQPDEVSGTRDEWSTVRARVFAPDGMPVSPRWNLRGLRGSELVRPSVTAVGEGFYLAWAERTERRAPLRPMGQRLTMEGRLLGPPRLLLDDPIENGWIQVEALPEADGDRVALFWQRPPPRAGDGVWLERLILPLP